MSEIKNYKPCKSFQIDLDDGTKVLLSAGSDNIKVFELGFLSIPKKTLHTFDIHVDSRSPEEIGHELRMKGSAQSTAEMLLTGTTWYEEEFKELAENLVEVKDISELVNKCKELEI